MRQLAYGLLLVGCLGLSALGQDPEPLEAELNPERLQERIEALDTNTDLDEAAREQVRVALQEALNELQRASELAVLAESFEVEAVGAPDLLAAILSELDSPPQPPAIEVPEGATLARIEQLVAAAEQDLALARESSEQLRLEQARRGERRIVLEQQIAAARQRLAEVDTALKVPQDPSPSGVARRLRTLALRRALRQEERAFRAELANYDARRELLPARIDRAGRRVSQTGRALEAWQAAAAERRRLDVAAATREAERQRLELARNSEHVQTLARENEELAHLRSGSDTQPGTAERLADATRKLTEMRLSLTALRERYASVRAKVEAAGLSNPMGLLLRRELENLPSAHRLRVQGEQRQAQIADLQYQLIARAEERTRAGDVEGRLLEQLRQVEDTLGVDQRADLERVLRELLTARRTLLAALLDDYELLFTRLLEIDNLTRQTIENADAYQAFIEERILWVPSVSSSTQLGLSEVWEALAWLFDVESWSRGLAASGRELLRRWQAVLLGLLAIVAVLFSRFWSRGRIRKMAGVVERDPGDNFGYTARATLIVLARAMAFPALIAGVGWALAAPVGQPDALLAAAAGLQAAALALFAYELLRQVLHSEGLGEIHFRWQGSVCAHVRGQLLWFIPIKLVTAFLVQVFDLHEVWNDTVGRAAFVVGLLALSIFNQRVLRPGGPVFKDYLRRHSHGWLKRLRWLWYPLAIGLPAVLALTALRGYYYTALRLESRLQAWMWMFLALLLVHALFLRWLRVARRRLLKQEKRESLDGAPESASAPLAQSPDDPASEPPASREAGEAAVRARAMIGIELAEAVDPRAAVPELDAQTRHLFRSLIAVVVILGTYMVWADVLPALRRLEQVQIYPQLRMVEASDAEAPSSVVEAAGAVKAEESVVPQAAVVTLADLGLALVVLAFTLVAAKNLPGLLEIIVLRQLPLDPGSRYAIKLLVRYAIVLVGFPFALARIGLTWDSVQWLAAAFTFGLAFGLQEIFANFVSGLIILFERPVRVGDVVTVAGTSGVVTRIRMRATTITDFDRKELIVPNKELVTGSVLNWVLTDPVVRLVIPVGVGYTARVDEARRLMEREARKHKLVLKQPPPTCQLRNLGGSCFDFELWLFVSSVQDMNTVRHDVTREVHRVLTAAGIDLPFPQQDVNLRSALPLPEAPPSKPSPPA